LNKNKKENLRKGYFNKELSSHLNKHKVFFKTKLANKILQKETIDGFEIRSLLYQTKTISVSQSENLKLEPVIPFDELLLDRVEKLINSEKYSTKLASVSSAEEEENLLDELLDEACAYLMILKMDNSEEYGRQLSETKAAKNRLGLSTN